MVAELAVAAIVLAFAGVALVGPHFHVAAGAAAIAVGVILFIVALFVAGFVVAAFVGRFVGRLVGVGQRVTDTTSGFRAYNREAAIQMAVVSKFTYTLETIIQAGKLLVATDARRKEVYWARYSDGARSSGPSSTP